MNPDPTGPQGPGPDPLAILDAVLHDDEPATSPQPMADAPEQPEPRAARPPAPATRYADVHAFVREHLAAMWSRLIRDRRQHLPPAPPAEHPAAHDRLTAPSGRPGKPSRPKAAPDRPTDRRRRSVGSGGVVLGGLQWFRVAARSWTGDGNTGKGPRVNKPAAGSHSADPTATNYHRTCR
jgi:hypothetical protein